MKRRMTALLLCAAMAGAVMSSSVLAASTEAETEETVVEPAIGRYVPIDYELKSLYDQQFDCIWIEGEATFADLVVLQSAPTLDLEKFINSAYGEKTAENFYTYINWDNDPMNPELVEYWSEKGLLKEYFPDETGAEDGIGDYYVYSPVDATDSDQSYPCIIVNHGGGEPAYQAETFGYCQIAAEEGIILIMAENTAADNLKTIFDMVSEEYPIDLSRVYITGSSAGGRVSKEFAEANPSLVAAVAALDNAPVYNGTEEQLPECIDLGLAIISIGGLQDKYYRFNLQQGVDETYDRHAELLDSTDGWNMMLQACGISDEYALTPEELRENRDYSLDLMSHLTGVKWEETHMDYRTNNTTYVNNMTNSDGIVTLRQVLTENHGHMPAGYDAEYAWDFMKHFSRDLETGELIYTE